MQNRTMPALSADNTEWLARTFARNQALYGGWSMDGSGDGSGDGAGGDGAGGSGDGTDNGAGGDGGDSGGKDGAADLGFPKDTAVADMKPAEQTAYWQHQARKHEDRNKEWQRALGGKTAAEIAAERQELTQLRTEKMTDGEKAVEQAKAEGRREASLVLAPQLFDVALSHVDKERRQVLIDNTDLSRVIKDDGTIDADKVKTIAAALAPAATDGEQRRTRDFGAGDRRTDKSSGVAAGREAFRERRGKKSTTTNDS
ncbi:MAG: hypothetical protein ABWX71_02540 [Aeromicrobium sp.]